MMEYVKQADNEVFQAMLQEKERQQDKIELIASENFVSRAVMDAMGSILTNKYAEGYPDKRYYGGCEYVDIVDVILQENVPRKYSAQIMPMYSLIPVLRRIWQFILLFLSREIRYWE